MSNSPWSAQDVIAQVQAEIAATPGLERGGMLLLAERAGPGLTLTPRAVRGRKRG